MKGAPGAEELNATYETLRARFHRGSRSAASPPGDGSPPAAPV